MRSGALRIGPSRNLILLSGLKPDDDIKIEFTACAPAGKLYEDLSAMLEGDRLAWLNYLREICARRNLGRLVVALKEIVLDYSPKHQPLRTRHSPQPPPSRLRHPLASLSYPRRSVAIPNSPGDRSNGLNTSTFS